jgi:hypothetical protein
MADFKLFAQSVRKRFVEMAATGALFCVASTRDEIWLTYLDAFPEGSNPIYRTRQEHDCSCCRHFIYNTGNVVAIQNGALASLWDLNGLPEPYQTVADAMSAYVKGLPIRDTFLTRFATHGQLISRAFIDNNVVQFDHFSAEIPRDYVAQDVATRQGNDRTMHDVFVRGLTELKAEALSTVLDLIEQNNLYRGAEFKRQLVEFAALRARYADATRLPASRERQNQEAENGTVRSKSIDQQAFERKRDLRLGKIRSVVAEPDHQRPASDRQILDRFGIVPKIPPQT